MALYCVYSTLLNTEQVASEWVAVYLAYVLAGEARRYEADKCDCDVSWCDVIMLRRLMFKWEVFNICQ
jgi:hypothetical protein